MPNGNDIAEFQLNKIDYPKKFNSLIIFFVKKLATMSVITDFMTTWELWKVVFVSAMYF